MEDKILNIRWNNKDKYIEFECNNTTCHYDLENVKKAIETSWKLQSQIDEVKEYAKSEIEYWENYCKDTIMNEAQYAINKTHKVYLSKLEEVGK